MKAPAKTSNRGTSWLTSTSVAKGQPASTTAFMAATSGDPDPKSEVKVTSGGGAGAPLGWRLPVAGLLPAICFIVVSALLPQNDPVAFHELYPPQPLSRLPEVFTWNKNAQMHACAARQVTT